MGKILWNAFFNVNCEFTVKQTFLRITGKPNCSFVFFHHQMEIVHTIIFGGREIFLILLMDTNGLI